MSGEGSGRSWDLQGCDREGKGQVGELGREGGQPPPRSATLPCAVLSSAGVPFCVVTSCCYIMLYSVVFYHAIVLGCAVMLYCGPLWSTVLCYFLFLCLLWSVMCLQ